LIAREDTVIGVTAKLAGCFSVDPAIAVRLPTQALRAQHVSMAATCSRVALAAGKEEPYAWRNETDGHATLLAHIAPGAVISVLD
jgi:hypothetical protein